MMMSYRDFPIKLIERHKIMNDPGEEPRLPKRAGSPRFELDCAGRQTQQGTWRALHGLRGDQLHRTAVTERAQQLTLT